MTQLDSSFMATTSSRTPMDALLETLRTQIIAEIKSDITTEIIDRIIKLVGSSLSNLSLNYTISVPDGIIQPQINCPTPVVDVEMNMDQLAAELASTRKMLQDCMTTLSAPIIRVVNRNPDGLILSITERRM